MRSVVREATFDRAEWKLSRIRIAIASCLHASVYEVLRWRQKNVNAIGSYGARYTSGWSYGVQESSSLPCYNTHTWRPRPVHNNHAYNYKAELVRRGSESELPWPLVSVFACLPSYIMNHAPLDVCATVLQRTIYCRWRAHVSCLRCFYRRTSTLTWRPSIRVSIMVQCSGPLQ